MGDAGPLMMPLQDEDRALHDSLAIVGMACRLPGADGLEAFWDLVVHGRTAWGRLPDSRLPRDLYFDPVKSKVGKSYSDLGAIVSERPADPAVCPIRADMLDRYDVAHHIFLEVASLACRDAGLDPFAMPRGPRTGVYVGHTGGSTRIGDYVYSTGIDGTTAWLGDVEAARELLGAGAESVAAEVTAAVRRDHPGRRPGEKLDLGALGAAKIVREALQLDGPYLVVDAACASSLQALAIAARALQQGGIDQAIVGGASYCKSDSLVLFSAAQSVSNSGSCPFGRDADGLVTAEGYVALIVKKLSKAIADGDRIRAVIRGIGVASDGKGKSLWAPRQEGQKLAVERAYPDKSEIGRLDYIEAHATSTQVGDATELGALSALVSANVPAGKKIPIGSVKANIGHTLETAGMASLVKVVLAMEHGLIPPGSTCSEYNEDFDWERGPFVVPSQSIPWPKRADGEARRAAVNAFGIGGLNVHLALAEHLPGRPAAALPPAKPKGTADDEAVAIVGIGSVLPGALSVEAFRSLVRQGKTAIGPVPASRFDVARALDPTAPRTWHTVAGVGGFVEGFVYDWRRHKVPPKQIAAANPLQFMLLEAADAAIAEVGGVAALDRVRTGVVVGTMFGGEFSNDLQMGLRLPETSRHLRTALGRRGIAPRDIERIVEGYGKKLLEKMPALVDETGSFTSSTLASRLTKSFDLMGGALALDSGDCSGVSALSAAVDLLRERDCDAVLCASGQRFLDLTAFEELSLAGLLADAPASPLAMRGEGRVPGEGAVVMVLKRLADARSAGNRIHGVIRGVAVGSGTSVAGATSRVVREARLQAGIIPSAVKVMEISGSGTRAIDEPELLAVTAEYGVDAVAGAVEGLVGHLGAAAAAAGLIKLADVLESGHMPAMVVAGSARAGLRVASTEPVAVPAVDASGYRAGCVTVVHDTQVGHVVMDNGLAVPAAARERAASSPAPVVIPAPSRSQGNALPVGRPLVAALFPGQGSQYTDMFRGLIAESPAARQAVETLDACARSAGFETLAGIAWQSDNSMGTAVWDTQWGMYLGDLLAWTVLERMGFSPDVIASHSFGEFPSLVAAGAWSFAEGARATQARAAAVEQLGPKQGAMLSVIARREEVAAAIEPFAGQVWVCAENAPEQSVIGGHARAVDAVEVLLEGRRIRSKRLAVPSPFHTPLLAAAAAKLAEAIDRMSIVPPTRRVYSSTTAAPMATVDDVRDSLVRQMTQTVRWVDVIEKLWADGVRTFVEVGPSGVLTGLTRRVLEGRDGATFIQFDQRGRDVAGHLAKVRDQLQAVGALGAAAVAPAVVGQSAPRPASVLSFDATARRRARNRAGGAHARTATTPRSPEKPASPAPHVQALPKAQTAVSGQPATVTAPPVAVQSVSVKPVPVPTAPVATGVNRLAPPAATQSAAPRSGAASELESFLVDFVVDQTGYPQEIVELDADLEGDLGIDSIRKAQLFGEIGQRYGLSADATVSLDDFRTLRHLLDYMLPRVGGASSSPAPGASAAPSRPLPPAQVAPALSASPAPSASLAPAASVGGELEAFLVDFVVEQTGYPQEIVELDADLEGDLGIDSIRKAQLFGEIGQRYGLSADASVSLDDFRTLRHLLDYMLPRVGGTAGGAGVSTVAAVAAAPAVPVLDAGRAAAIRQWTREFAAAAPAAGTAVKLSADAVASIEATAAAAGVDAALLLAAMASPATALGGLDVVLGDAAHGARGIAIGFGRHAAPCCDSFSAEGLSGYLVGIEGLPGGLVGWNDAGLIVVAGRGAGVGGGLPLTSAVERLACCRTLSDAGRLAASLAPIGGSVIVAVDGTIGLIDGHGRMVDGGTGLVDCAALAALVKVAGDAAGHVDLHRLLAATAGAGVRDGLSATATWLAAGAVEGATVSFAGGPRGSWLPSPAATMLASAWQTTAAAQTASALTPAVAEVTGRFGLALADLAPAAPTRNLAGERMFVLVGTDSAGRALAAEIVSRLTARACEVIALPLTSSSDVLAGIAAAEALGPVRHLVLAAPWSAGEDWVTARESAVNAGYFACQRFLAARTRAGDSSRSTLTAVTGLGGDFGLGGQIGSVVGGAYAGLCKNLAREYSEVQIRVADFATAALVADVAARVIAEVESAGPVEVGWQGASRRTVVAVAGVPRAAAPLAGLAKGSVWLVTGGARGVTAACARALGAKHGLNLVLVGSTRPLPIQETWLTLDEAGLKALKSQVMLDAKARGGDPRRAWRDVEKSIEIASGLAKFRAAGVIARYEACDLADGAAVRQLVGRIEREVGPIRGIVHGAGWESACKFEKKTAEGLEATIGPKCIGLEHVVAAVDPRHLESVVAFGSTSGRLGGLGQADYSLANDMLAKIVGRLRSGRRSLRATVFHWHAWDEVGMASRPESRFVLEQFGMKFMPLAEGVGRFLTEIEAGLPEAEVLVTEPVFCLDTLSTTVSHAHAAAPAAPAGSCGSLVAAVEKAGRVTNVAMVLDPTTDRFLLEHLQHGRPLLPAVMGAELLAQATIAAGVCQRVEEIRDFVVERPIGFPTDQPREVRVDIEDAASGQVSARGWTAVRGSHGREADMPRVHVSATVLVGAAEPIAEPLDEMPLPFNPMIYQDNAPLWHGPGFRTLSGLFLDRSGGWGRLTAPDPDAIAKPRGAGGWTVPVAMLDGAIVACAVYSFILFRKRVEVPLRFDRLRITGQAATKEKCTVRLWFRSQDLRESIYDFVIYGDDGRALVALDGLHLAIVSPERSKPS
jgi:acyl transferase domain-containing protein/acyl carrier protein/NADP-dependent 3-hydroxy acid dehydrogenase YdfG